MRRRGSGLDPIRRLTSSKQDVCVGLGLDSRPESPRLKEAFGLLIPSVIAGAAHLWEQMRLAKPTLAAILGFLAQSRNISLLGDYRCLRLPS